MKAFLALVLCVPASAAQETYARPADGTVLRVGPGDGFAGVLEVGADSVLRLGEVRGAYRQVFVAEGFPIYLHEDYVEVDETQARVAVAGDRVNARALPTTVGNDPVGHVGSEHDDLVLLGREGRWVRVVAPEDLPLHVPQDALLTTDVAAGEVLWERALEVRAARRAWMLAAFQANDPTWRQETAWREEVAWLGRQPLATAPEAELAQRRERLRRIGADTSWAPTRDTVEAALAALDHQLEQRAATSAPVALLPATPPEPSAQAALPDPREREARFLGLGLLFQGRGVAIQRTGTVVQEAVGPDAALYVLQTYDGARYKLTAPINRPRLADLVGKRVELVGRELELASVSGPVLVVDRIVWQER